MSGGYQRNSQRKSLLALTSNKMFLFQQSWAKGTETKYSCILYSVGMREDLSLLVTICKLSILSVGKYQYFWQPWFPNLWLFLVLSAGGCIGVFVFSFRAVEDICYGRIWTKLVWKRDQPRKHLLYVLKGECFTMECFPFASKTRLCFLCRCFVHMRKLQG